MIRLWLAKGTLVPVHAQLVSQLTLGILSQELRPGERLPSVRELGRRLGLHANTISAVYQELTARGWLEHRRGGYVHVRKQPLKESESGGGALDQLFSSFLWQARQAGVTESEIHRKLREWLSRPAPDRILLIEPEPELRAIVAAEIQEALNEPISTAGFDALEDASALNGALVVCTHGRALEVQPRLPPDAGLFRLRLRSMPAVLSGETRPPATALIAMASHSAEVLSWALRLLSAAIDPDALLLKDAREAGWQDGLAAAQIIGADIVTARLLTPDPRVRVIHLLDRASLDELRAGYRPL